MNLIIINPDCILEKIIDSNNEVGVIEYSKVELIEAEENFIKIKTDIFNLNNLGNAIMKINNYFGKKCDRFLISYMNLIDLELVYDKIVKVLNFNFNINKLCKGVDQYYITVDDNILENRIDRNIFKLVNSNFYYMDSNYLVITEKLTMDMIVNDNNSKIDKIDKKDILDVIKHMIQYKNFNGKIELESREKRIL